MSRTTKPAAGQNPDLRQLVHVLAKLLGVKRVSQSDEAKAIMVKDVSTLSKKIELGNTIKESAVEVFAKTINVRV